MWKTIMFARSIGNHWTKYRDQINIKLIQIHDARVHSAHTTEKQWNDRKTKWRVISKWQNNHINCYTVDLTGRLNAWTLKTIPKIHSIKIIWLSMAASGNRELRNDKWPIKWLVTLDRARHMITQHFYCVTHAAKRTRFFSNSNAFILISLQTHFNT